ncbi:MAG: polysulfide reductase NrfD [Deltaproteobacteria bacterium]|nr:polysulfide reductase NrfD [Deltaproteobacteria bacterium]MBW1913541.1 polysulfide reductase NrfD [Deltaproteobacteria bacterium]
MLDKAIKGSQSYWGWIGFLILCTAVGAACYSVQFVDGLMVTGMGRDVSWGFYIGQLTYFVGVAAGGVMVVLPCYLHDYKAFSRITILGEFLAVGAIIICGLFVMVDLGNLPRMMNIMIYPNLKSILFWDMIVLNTYLIFNLLIGWNVLTAERKGVPYPKWVKVLTYISIPWAFSIHTVTAFLYAGIPGRHYWLTAVMAVRFLTSAFASGPAILILLCLIIRKVSRFDPGKEQINTLGKIVAYAMILNVFCFGLECFTAFYSQIPGHMHSLVYLFSGLHGYNALVPWMWTATVFGALSLVLLIVPSFRNNETGLMIACGAVIISTWIDKGFGLVLGGFIPNPFEAITEYMPTSIEIGISVGVWAIGALVITILYKIVISVKEEVNP